MSIFKCKMCGGTIEFSEGTTVGICDSCGTKQTLPRLDDEKRANLYDRANHFRRNNDFEKAMGIYEQILNEDSTDAEAYWSLVLCRYGIEYVEDPSTHKRIPTINRTQFTSVFADENYKSALQYADNYQRTIYEEEARAIDDIQKGILEISNKEEPFDVFICYKETDTNGRRTQDSVLANDLYHQLIQEGFKVFFSRITLEDKLGIAYEPYIFAALNSSKVMVVLGTKPEYFNAVWVKNEWSRYLALIKNGAEKMLIPAYKDMDPYDLPEEFSHLQAQDMSKLGFMQDLIRGIKKIVSLDESRVHVKETVVIESGNINTTPLLERAFMFLEDGEWEEADEYCEKVLDQNPRNAMGYVGKLMAELNVKKQDELMNCDNPFDDRNNYEKAIRFADGDLANTLKGYISYINERNENARLNGIYNSAVSAMNSAKTEMEFKKAFEQFHSISSFKDADAFAEKCLEKAESARKDEIYDLAKISMRKENVSSYESAIQKFATIPGWKDADEQISVCKQRIEEIKVKEEADRLERERKAEEQRIAEEKAAKKRKKIAVITASVVCVCIAFLIVLNSVIIPNGKYNDAVALMDAGKYEEAYEAFKNVDYKDSAEKAVVLLKEHPEVVQVGETLIWGSYEQDNNTSNGKEDIEWLVLAKEENRFLVISKYALDCQPYHTLDTDITWENCSLRTWLNGTFLDSAFNESEQAMILKMAVSADKNPSYSTNPGSETQDKVFLLSIAEVDKYFPSDGERQCKATNYAEAQGVYASDYNENCKWWLRTPGSRKNRDVRVASYGEVKYYGCDVAHDSTAVRPALWLNLEP